MAAGVRPEAQPARFAFHRRRRRAHVLRRRCTDRAQSLRLACIGQILSANAAEQFGERHQLAHVDPAQQRHLEVISRLRGDPHVGLGFREDIERAQQILARETRHERRHPIALRFGGNFRIGDARRIHGQDEEIANDTRQLAHDGAKVVAELYRLVPTARTPRLAVSSATAVTMSSTRSRPTSPSTVADIVYRDLLSGKRDDLIERALRIAHAAVGRAGHEQQRGIVHRDLLRRCDVLRIGRQSGGSKSS